MFTTDQALIILSLPEMTSIFPPNGGLTENGPYEFVLSGDSSFHKILNFTRLFGEFHLVDPATGNLIDDAVDVSFVNNIGHSWISSIEVF